MGFVNPGNSAFQDALSSKIYVDKTELISYMNSVIDTTEKFICNSRPRRFGKTMAADMLTAYYCKNCNSEKMFSGLKISNDNSFKKYLNQYDVIHFDVQWCMIAAGSPENTVPYINKYLIKELKELYAMKDEIEKVNNKLNSFFLNDFPTSNEVEEEYDNYES